MASKFEFERCHSVYSMMFTQSILTIDLTTLFTVLVLSKLKKYMQPPRHRNSTFYSILRYFRTLQIVWSLAPNYVQRS